MNKEIYLDLDGVCVDFISAAVRAHGFNPEETLDEWSKNHAGEFHPYVVLDIEMDAFWEKLHSLGEEFWVNLKPYPWFENLYHSLTRMGEVIFCTSTTRSPTCVSGKLKWLQEQFGTDFNRYIFTAHKDRLAHPNAYLIDDFDANIERFSSRGGNGILFPQIWNSQHYCEQNPIEFIEKRLFELGKAKTS